MVDWLDRAQEREERDRELALRTQLASHRSGTSLKFCDDCGEEIPEARRALGGMTRCTPCQTQFEKSNRR